MGNMSYCRHENTAGDLADVWEQWEDWDEASKSEYEREGRRRIIQLVRQMHEQFDFDGTYDDLDERGLVK